MAMEGKEGASYQGDFSSAPEQEEKSSQPTSEKQGFSLDDALSLVDGLLNASEEEEFTLDYELDFGDAMDSEQSDNMVEWVEDAPLMEESALEAVETLEEVAEPEEAATVEEEPAIQDMFEDGILEESMGEVPQESSEALAVDMSAEEVPETELLETEFQMEEIPDIQDGLVSDESTEKMEEYEDESDDVMIEEDLADLDSSFDTFFSDDAEVDEIDSLLESIPDELSGETRAVEEDLTNSPEEEEAMMSLLSELSGDVDDEDVEVEDLTPDFNISGEKTESDEISIEQSLLMDDDESKEVEDLVPSPRHMHELEEEQAEEGLDPMEDLLAMASDDEGAANSGDPVSVDDIFQDALSAVAYSENEEELSLEEFMSADLGDQLLQDADPKKRKKKAKADKKKDKLKERVGGENMGFFQRIFGNIITEDTAEEEARQRMEEEVDEEQKKKDKESRKRQAQLNKEAKAQQAAENQERKKQLKAEQAAKKEEAKKEKQRLKEERLAEEANEVVGRINPIGATIVIIFFVTIGAATIITSSLVARNRSLKTAENQFASGEYVEAYKTISAVDVKEDEEMLYQKILLCSQLQKEIKSFENYQTMNMPLEALDSLVKGVATYDGTLDEADEAGVTDELNKMKDEIVARIKAQYNLSEEKAREISKIEGRTDYTSALQNIVKDMPKQDNK